MQAGVYLDITNADYHGGEGINKGLLDFVARSPMHAKALLDQANDNKREPTPAMILGTAFHTLLLEPNKFADEYVCELTQADAPYAIADRDTLVERVTALNIGRLPKLATTGTKAELLARIEAGRIEQGQPLSYDGESLDALTGAALKIEIERLNADRHGLFPISGDMGALAAILAANGQPVTLWADVRSRWRVENEGFTVLSVETYEQLLAMAHSVRTHPAANALLTGCEGVAEASVYWTDPVTGELCRCRPDWWRKDGVMVDVKTSLDASGEGFAQSLAKYRYHVQAPWYVGGMTAAHDAGHFPEGWAKPKAFVFLAVEKTAPYAVAAYVLDAETIQIGTAQMRANLDTLAECKRTGVWPGYGDMLQTLGVPQWYLNRNMHLIGAA